MSQPAQYLVIRQPGADVAGLGFVKAGFSFFAPSADYVPSRYFRAMNAAAQDGLRRLKAELERFDAQRAADLKDRKDPDGRPIKVPNLAAEVNLDLFAPVREEPKVQDAGVSAVDLSRLGAQGTTSFAAEGSGKSKSTTGKRTADG